MPDANLIMVSDDREFGRAKSTSTRTTCETMRIIAHRGSRAIM